MKAIPPIKSVMTPFPHWIEVDEPLARARDVMAEHEIRYLPVMERGKLVGVLTEKDMRKAETSGGTDGDDTLVKDVCDLEAYVVGLSEPLDHVLSEMADKHIGSALVVKDGKLAGIFTLTDACRCFEKLLHSLFPTGGNDNAA